MTTPTPIALEESILSLELALANEEWIQLGYTAQNEFSRDGLRKIIELSRLSGVKNPIIKRGVRLQTFYVFGRGVNIVAKDETINEVIQAFIDDQSNQTELTSAQARKQRDIELTVDGNLFFAFFVQPDTGNVRIGTIPVDEITEIIRDPNNRKRNIYYKREWQTQALDLATGEIKVQRNTRYYRDYRYPDTRATIGSGEKAIQVDQAATIYHVKVGAYQDWAYGLPETYAALDWARAYKSFLEDFAKIIKSLARFAWRKRVGGGAAGVAAAKRKLNSTLGQGLGTETNPSPNAGSVYISNDGDDLDPIKTAGSTTSADEGRALRMMAGIAMGLPDTMASGDADQGTLATAKTLDRPTEFQFADRQELWIGIFKTIFDFVIYNAVAAPNGALRGLGEIVTNSYNEPVVLFPDDVEETINIDFPSLIEQDPESRVRSLISAAAYIPDRKVIATQLLTDLGFDDVDELIEQMYPEGYDAEIDPLGQSNDPLTQALDAVQESLRDLQEAVTKWK